MKISAKVCGLSTPTSIDAAVKGGASYIGFVFFPKSPRHVEPEQVSRLAAQVPDHVKRIGVFVDPDDQLLGRVITGGALDVVQLHRTTSQRVAAIRERHAIETWAAVAVRSRNDLDAAKKLVGAADRILYDARTPDDAALPGGMGIRFDWDLLDGFSHPLPWALSGGLNAGNVAEAIRKTGASIVDVSSGVEGAPGEKNCELIRAFLAAVAAA